MKHWLPPSLKLCVLTASFTRFVKLVLPTMIQVASMLYKLGITEQEGWAILSRFQKPDASIEEGVGEGLQPEPPDLSFVDELQF